jgi:primosomal protein N''
MSQSYDLKSMLAYIGLGVSVVFATSAAINFFNPDVPQQESRPKSTLAEPLAGQGIEDQQMRKVTVFVNLGKNTNDATQFQEVYVATKKNIDRVLDPIKTGYLKQLAYLERRKRANDELIKSISNEIDIRQGEILAAYSGWMQTLSEYNRGELRVTRKSSARKRLDKEVKDLGEVDRLSDDLEERLSGLRSRLAECQELHEELSNEIVVVRQSISSTSWFPQLPRQMAKRYHCSTEGRCEVLVSTSEDSYIWTEAHVDSYEGPQTLRWFARCSDVIDDAGVVALTRGNADVIFR